MAGLPDAPVGFSVSWTPSDVKELIGALVYGSHDGSGTEAWCRAQWRPRPERCMRVTCNLCGTYWDGEAPDFVNAVTFYGSHQQFCRKRPMSVVLENLARMQESITGDGPWPCADYPIAQELDYAAREYNEHPWTYQQFMSLLAQRIAKIERNRPLFRAN